MKRLLFTTHDGLYFADTPAGQNSSGTLEGLIGKLAPDAPEAWVHHCAEVLEGLLGPSESGSVITGVRDA